jgi:hypothetical protein
MSYNNSNQRSLSNDEYLNVSTLAGDAVDVYSTSTSTLNVKLYQTLTYPITKSYSGGNATLTTDQLMPGTILTRTINGSNYTDTLPTTASMITAVETFLGRPWGVYEEYSMWFVGDNTGGSSQSVSFQQPTDLNTLLRRPGAATQTTINVVTSAIAGTKWWCKLYFMRISSTQILFYSLAVAA